MAKKSKATAEGKKSKKKTKASTKKTKDSGGDDENFVTVADLAEEAEITPQSARVKLRDAEVDRPEGGRWKWKKGSAALKEARKVLDL